MLACSNFEAKSGVKKKMKKMMPPKPTEIKDNRIKMGQRKSRTVEEINYDIKFQAEMDRKNLNPIIE